MKDLIAQFQNNTPIADIIKGEADKLHGILASEVSFWGKVTDFIQNFGYWVYILLALGLIVALFGKKLLPLAKFFGFLLIGFTGGVLYLSPYITFIPAWITGLVIGVIAAIFCKIFYYLVVAGSVGGALYLICWNKMFLPQLTQYTEGKWYFCAIAAAVAILLVLLLLKWIEMAGTSFLGAWLFTASIQTLTNFMALDFIANFNKAVYWAIVGIVALIGFIIQVKTRKRY